jgi:hypothetical protein
VTGVSIASDRPPLPIPPDLRWAEGNLTCHNEPSSVLHRTEFAALCGICVYTWVLEPSIT